MKRLKERGKGKPQPTVAPPVEDTPTPVRVWRSVASFAILLGVMLLLWRAILLKPLLTASRATIQGCFRILPFPHSGSSELITVDPGNGDWIVHAALLHLREREITHQIAGANEAGVRMQPVMLQLFSVCLPIFWALTLAVWPGKSAWRILGSGTLVLAIVSQVSLVVFLFHWINRYFVVASSPWGEYWLQLAGYFTLNVAPIATPLISVLWLHQKLRSLVFGGFLSQISPNPGP